MSGSGRSPLRDPGQPQAQWPDSLHLAQGVFGFPLPLAWLPTAMAVSSGRLWVSTLLRRLGLKGSKELSLPFVFALFFLFVLFLLLYFSIIVNWGWSFRISVIGVPGPKARFCNLRQTSGAAWVRKWSFKINCLLGELRCRLVCFRRASLNLSKKAEGFLGALGQWLKVYYNL